MPALLGCKDDPAYGAALFHATVAAGLGDWAGAAARRENQSVVAVGGGCAMNRVLMAALRGNLAATGIDLLEARQAPPNDGGLALGQAWLGRRLWLAGLAASEENQGETVSAKEMT